MDLVQAQIRIAGGASLADIGLASQARQLLQLPDPRKYTFEFCTSVTCSLLHISYSFEAIPTREACSSV